MNAKEILLAAAELIAQPNAHSKGTFARDNQGTGVSPTSKLACSWWCMLGAVRKVGAAGGDGYMAAVDALNAVTKPDIPGYNDNPRTTQASAVRKLRQAAKAAK